MADARLVERMRFAAQTTSNPRCVCLKKEARIRDCLLLTANACLLNARKKCVDIEKKRRERAGKWKTQKTNSQRAHTK